MNGKTEHTNAPSERFQIQSENNPSKFENKDNQIIPRTQSAAAKPKSKLKPTSTIFTIPSQIDPQSKPFIPSSQPITEFVPKEEPVLESIPMTQSITISSSSISTTAPVSSATTETNNLSTSQVTTAPATTEKPKKKLQLKKESQAFVIPSVTSEQSFKPTENVIEKPNTEWGQFPLKKPLKSPEKLPGEQKPALSNINPTKSEEFKVEEAKPVETKVEEPKAVEKQPAEQTFVPVQKVAEVVVSTWSRADFDAEIQKLRDALASVELPAELAAVVERKVSEYKPASKPQKKPGMNPNPRAMDQSQSQTAGQFNRGGSYVKSRDDVPQMNSSGIQRVQMTEEEIKKKKELTENVGKWINTISKVDDEDEKNRRMIRMNLNKLTPQNFDAVKEDIINIVTLKPGYVEVVSELIIENAWTQKKYANIYAKLCNFLGSHDKIPVEDSDPKKKRNKFKSVTLKKIQKVFQNEETIDGKIKKPESELTKEEKIEIHDKKLKKILGNVCFIGELFLEKFIVIDIVRIITRTQLNSFLSEYDHYQKSPEDQKPLFRNYEDTLEGLLKFYELIGKDFEDKEKAKGVVDKAASAKVVEAFEENLFLAHSSIEGDAIPPLPEKENVTLEDLFKIFDLVLEKTNLTQRLAALIRNLKHRKENNWNAPLYKNQGPQKIDEIHQEYQKELEQQERNKELYYEEMNNSRGSRGKKGRDVPISYVQYEPKVKSTSSNEEKLDLSNVKGENVVMKPQRGKTHEKQETKEEKKSNEESNLEQLDHAKRDFKEIFDKLADEAFEGSLVDEVEDILRLMKEKIRSSLLAVGFFQTFYDGKISSVNNNRIPLAQFLVDRAYITQDEFIQGFAEATKEVYFSDFPQSGNFFAKVFLEFAQVTSGKYKLSSALPLPDEMPEDEDDESLDFHKELVTQVSKKLTSEYSNLKKELEADVASLAGKLKV